MPQWEYKVVKVRGAIGVQPGDDPAVLLEKLGDEGWELVAIRPASNALAEVLYLKRPKSAK